VLVQHALQVTARSALAAVEQQALLLALVMVVHLLLEEIEQLPERLSVRLSVASGSIQHALETSEQLLDGRVFPYQLECRPHGLPPSSSLESSHLEGRRQEAFAQRDEGLRTRA